SWISCAVSRLAHWNCPNQAKNRPSGVLAWWVMVAPRTSTPKEKRDRAASTWDGVRSTHSSARRNAVSTALLGPGDGAKQLDGSSALTHTNVLLQRCSALKASANSRFRVRQNGWRNMSV